MALAPSVRLWRMVRTSGRTVLASSITATPSSRRVQRNSDSSNPVFPSFRVREPRRSSLSSSEEPWTRHMGRFSSQQADSTSVFLPLPFSPHKSIFKHGPPDTNEAIFLSARQTLSVTAKSSSKLISLSTTASSKTPFIYLYAALFNKTFTLIL